MSALREQTDGLALFLARATSLSSSAAWAELAWSAAAFSSRMLTVRSAAHLLQGLPDDPQGVSPTPRRQPAKAAAA